MQRARVHYCQLRPFLIDLVQRFLRAATTHKSAIIQKVFKKKKLFAIKLFNRWTNAFLYNVVPAPCVGACIPWIFQVPRSRAKICKKYDRAGTQRVLAPVNFSRRNIKIEREGAGSVPSAKKSLSEIYKPPLRARNQRPQWRTGHNVVCCSGISKWEAAQKDISNGG